jgi:hypothetical protein
MGDYLCIHLYYCEICNIWKHRSVQPQFL